MHRIYRMVKTWFILRFSLPRNDISDQVRLAALIKEAKELVERRVEDRS